MVSSVLGHSVSFPLETIARRLQVRLSNSGMHRLTPVTHDLLQEDTFINIVLSCHGVQY